MPEVVNCPQCERKLRVPEELLGKKVKCPTCGNTFTAEAGAGTSEPAPPPPPQEEERPPRGEFQEEERPSRRPPRREEREEFDEERPRRRPRGSYAEHRGTLILVFGILGLVVCGIFAPIAWIMGNGDLTEIRAGRMDPEGESMTNIGRILGMVGTILQVVAIVGTCCVIGAMGIFGGAMGGRR